MLRTNRFEAFRWRLGRRSSHFANLDWTGDAAPVFDHLVVVRPGPRATSTIRPVQVRGT